MRGGRPPLSSRAIADCVVPVSSASCACESPSARRRSDTWPAIWAKNQPFSAWAIRSRIRSNAVGLIFGLSLMLFVVLLDLSSYQWVKKLLGL